MIHFNLICLDNYFSNQNLIPFKFWIEKGTQNVAMFLRSVPNWEIVESLPDIGENIDWNRNNGEWCAP